MIVRNKFYTLPEILERHTPKDKHENFVTAHFEAVAECIPTKARVNCRVPLVSLIGKNEIT